MPLDLANMEIILYSVVAVLQGAELRTFSEQDVSAILRRPLTITQEVGGNLILESVRSQIQIRIRQSRVEIRDLSGNPPSEKPLAHHLRYLVNLLGGEVATAGLNAHLSIPIIGEESAGSFLAERLLQSSRVENDIAGQVIGFGGRISFQRRDGTIWNLVLEPLGNDPETNQVFLNLNHSHRYEPLMSTPLTESWAEQMDLAQADGLGTLEEWLRRFQQDG